MLRRSIVLAALAGSGCYVDTDPAPRPVPVGVTDPTVPSTGIGTLVVRWTIDGRTDPNACVQAGAIEIDIGVFDPGGNEIGGWRAFCDAFSTSIQLNAGNYSAAGTLINSAGQARTTTVFIDPFFLRGNETFDVAIEFPASSFR